MFGIPAFRNRSISNELILGLVVVLVLVSGITLCTSYYIAVKRGEAELAAKADEQVALLKDVLEMPLWDFDAETIRAIGQTYQENDLVAGLKIEDSRGREYYSFLKQDKQPVVTRTSEILHLGHGIGQVEISLASAYITRMFRHLFWSYFLTITTNLLALIIVTGILLRYLLRKPLRLLNTIVTSYSEGKYDSFDDHMPYVELAPFVRTLDDMGRKIRSHLSTIENAEKKYRGIFENATEGLFQSTPQGRLISANPAFAQMLGYPSPEMLMESVSDIGSQLWLSGEERKRFIELIERSSRVFSYEARMVRKDGTIIWGSINSRIVQDEGGSTHHYEGIVQDITERKRAEEELKRYRHHLEELVEERTRLLEEQTVELQKAMREAEVANLAKSQFLSNVSHELRTPLNSILGYAQILKRRKDLNEAHEKGLDVILSNGSHLLQLINEILDLARIEAGKIELEETCFHLPAFLRDIADVMAVRAHKKGIGFEHLFPENLPRFVKGDPKRLKQVLLNLLGNAVKFTEMGRVTLKVKARELPGACTIRFEVQDTGIGIPADKLEEIFSPFKQVARHARQIEGTGLGLSISRQLVRLMGGELHVESVENRGSTFRFDLALEEVSHVEATGRPDDRAVKGYEGCKRKILVVDDKPEARQFLADLLRDVGFDVFEAVDGKDALAKVSDTRPDLVLMDLVMPEMDGLEAIRHIRGPGNASENLKVVMVSADVSEEKRGACLKAGCDGFITKPVLASDLFAELDKHLGLCWNYEEEEPSGDPAEMTEGEGGELVAPAAHVLRALHAASTIYDYEGVHAQLDGIESSGSQYLPFTRKIRGLARAFRMAEVTAFIEELMAGRRQD